MNSKRIFPGAIFALIGSIIAPAFGLVGGRYYAEKPGGRLDWGLRFIVKFVFSK